MMTSMRLRHRQGFLSTTICCGLALSSLLGLAVLSGCGGASQDDSGKTKLATDLVQCRNDLLTLKEQLAQAKADLLKAQQSSTVKLDGVEVKAGGNPSGGNSSKEGNVSPEAVAKVIKLNASGFRACYEKALKRKPDLQYISQVTAHFSVRNTGNAQGVGFAPHTDGDMEHCMSGLMEKWKFPTFQGDPVSFEVPVSLIAR
jgi:hypothetical protein